MWGWMIREGRTASSAASWSLTAWNLRLLRNMGGGPRTFPGGVSKWKWKRMHEKRAKEKQRNLLEQEKQLYQARIRSHIRSTLSPSSYSSSSTTHNPISPDQHIKALADRFMKDGALDLWNDLDGPETYQTQTQAQAQIQSQASPQIDLRSRNLNNYSQIRGYRSVPEVKDSIRSVPRVRDLSDQNRVGTEKPERQKIWRKNDSSSDSDSESEVESKNEGYYSKVGSIAALGKYDVKRVRRMKPKDFDDQTDFSEQVELIKNELKKKKLSRHEEENQGQGLENVLSQTRYCYSFDGMEMVIFFFVCGICI